MDFNPSVLKQKISKQNLQISKSEHFVIGEFGFMSYHGAENPKSQKLIEQEVDLGMLRPL